MGNRESRQTTVEPESCGEESALLPLIWLIFPWGFDPLETSTQFASLVFTYTQLSFGFSFNKCQMILKLTCAISQWYFFPLDVTLFLPSVTDFSNSVK